MLLMHQIHRRAATAAAQLRLIMWTVCFVNYCTLESVDSRRCSSATQDSIKSISVWRESLKPTKTARRRLLVVDFDPEKFVLEF